MWRPWTTPSSKQPEVAVKSHFWARGGGGGGEWHVHDGFFRIYCFVSIIVTTFKGDKFVR